MGVCWRGSPGGILSPRVREGGRGSISEVEGGRGSRVYLRWGKKEGGPMERVCLRGWGVGGGGWGVGVLRFLLVVLDGSKERGEDRLRE